MSEPRTIGYRYLFAQQLHSLSTGALTDEYISTELPLTGVNFTQQLNSIGTLTGHLLLSGLSSNLAPVDVYSSTIPIQTILYVERDWYDENGDRQRKIVWGGLIWGRTFNSDTQTLTIQAREFESYWEKRFVHDTFVFYLTDPLVIARDLATWVNDVPYGDIGITLGTETSSEQLTRTYHSYELKTLYQALMDLSRSEGFGFDFRIECTYGGSYSSGIKKTLRLGWPKLGTTYVASNPAALMFESPGIVAYEYPEDGTACANQVYALGGGTNEEQLQMRAQDVTRWQAGWPLVEGVGHYSDVYTVNYLQKLALSQVNATSFPPTTLKIVVSGSGYPSFGTYGIGDEARIRLSDDFFNTEPMDAVYRIVALSIEVGEDGPERITLTLTLPNADTGTVG